MDLERTFSLDRIPVSFGAKLVKHEGITARALLDSAMKEVLSSLWQQGGFRFIHKSTSLDIAYYYYCAQDKAKERVGSQEYRDVQRMERYDCQSYLKIRLCFQSRALFVSIHHEHHRAYIDKHLSTAVLEFSRERITSSPPAEIFRDVQDSNVPGSDLATQHQAYYRYIYRFY